MSIFDLIFTVTKPKSNAITIKQLGAIQSIIKSIIFSELRIWVLNLQFTTNIAQLNKYAARQPTTNFERRCRVFSSTDPTTLNEL